jgi:hypothetical protein
LISSRPLEERVAVTEAPSAGTDRSSDADEVDLLNLLPPSWRRWWSSVPARWRRADSAALAVILGQLLIVGPVVARGSLYIDDWRAQSYAAGQPFWPWIVESNGTHFSPGARTIDWLQTTLFPLQHGPAVVITLLVRVVLGVAIWAALRLLVGPRSGAVVALALALTTASLLPATAWYRQSITELPAIIAILLCTASLVRFVRRPRWSGVLAVLVWLALGLAFLEKTVVVVPWLVGLSIFLLPSTLGLPRRTVLRRAALPVAAATALVLGFVAAYLSSPNYDKGNVSQVSVADLGSLVWQNLTRALPPAVVGGPWQWAYPTPYYGVADPPGWLVVSALVVVLATILLAVRRSPGWTLAVIAAFLFFYLPCVAVVAAGRLSRFGPAAGLELRLWADAIVMVIVLGAVMLLGGGARRPRAAEPATLVAGAEEPHAAPTGRGRRLARWIPAGLALVAVTVNVAHSTVLFAQEWAKNPAGDYVARLRADVAADGSRPSLVAVAAPAVVPVWVQPDYSTEDLLAPLRTGVTFHITGPGTVMALDAGSLGAPRWSTVSDVVPPPSGWCGYAVPAGGRPFQVDFPSVVPYFRDAQLRVAVLLSRRTDLEVELQGADGPWTPATRSGVSLAAGAYRLMWRLPDSSRPASFTIRATDPTARLCITGASIAAPNVDLASAGTP